MCICRALILGPDDTPYAMGAFVFDIHLPPEYPNRPPSVGLHCLCWHLVYTLPIGLTVCTCESMTHQQLLLMFSDMYGLA